MRKGIILLLFMCIGCVHQRVYYNSYDNGWYIETRCRNYSREYWYTNADDTGKYLRQEREVAIKVLEMLHENSSHSN